MIEVNEKELKIVIGHSLDWDNEVEDQYNYIKDDIEYDYEENSEEFDEEELANQKKFLDYELTNEDKIAILTQIKDDYIYEVNHNEYSSFEVNIHDEDGIQGSIRKWIKDKFDFDFNA